MKRNRKNYYCSHCKQIIESCDSGWGHKFRKGDKIICKKRKLPCGSLHFCNDYEMDDAILDVDIPVRTYGEDAIVIFK